jgi:tRNA pseudouridine38-40 synthase
VQNHRLDISYQGTRFEGWQVQPGRPTVQGLLETVLADLYGERIHVVGSGRTDAGAHALGQVANFRAPARLPVDRLPIILNSRLPADVRVLRAARVPAAFHAQRSARSKLYRYQVFNGRILSPFDEPFYHRVFQPLDVGAMAAAARGFLGRHDFTSFCAHAEADANHVREVFRADIGARGHRILFLVEASGFLHHMVRNMAGTLLEVGLGSRPADDIPRLLAARDRRRAGPTAPACGLFLVRVWYRRRPPTVPESG